MNISYKNKKNRLIENKIRIILLFLSNQKDIGINRKKEIILGIVLNTIIKFRNSFKYTIKKKKFIN